MAIVDYRFDPFLNSFNVKPISGEIHQIPTNSPYEIKLVEVPQKTDPSTLHISFSSGQVLTEVAAQPAQGQYWPDYLTKAHGIADWNTGTILFNAQDAGKTVVVSYNGIGTLVDSRIASQLTVNVSSSTQPDREAIVNEAVSYDSTMTSGKGNTKGVRGRLLTHRGIGAGTYTLGALLQKLVNLSHTQEYKQDIYRHNTDCDCGDDSGA
ncbi:hypothetical protein [uncultured Dialister sp.]|uniref:hypothetical protein n=1 Tax=uncultured Dialister sp. TaxID=278064 RepID=UPI0020606392|nr:hypothetical protein [uncultured Dialister sp.]DAZ68448.1 MAG TPA: hypothetical protein [Caudoviricetes sp.]